MIILSLENDQAQLLMDALDNMSVSPIHTIQWCERVNMLADEVRAQMEPQNRPAIVHDLHSDLLRAN